MIRMLEEYVAIDLEMTGLSSFHDKIIEIGAVKVRGGRVTDTYEALVNPNMNIPDKIIAITGISGDMVQDEPYIGDILQDFLHFLGDNILIGHNLKFDFSFLMQAAYEGGEEWFRQQHYGIDTLKIARKYMEAEVSKKLEDLCNYYHIEDEHHHRALNDAKITEKLYRSLCLAFETEQFQLKPELLVYKPKKERPPSKKEIQRVERIIEERNPDRREDIYRMSQSELSRYADFLLSQRKSL